MSRIYVKQVKIVHTNDKNTEGMLDQAIIEETKKGSIFRAITSFYDDGMSTYTIVFER